ncbi:hypothetical protein HN51_030434 [Arachis hypogaea]|uniref:Uncharacterized protein n=1 Tax=Arachis hypogaea TaxID=3818 RepID=A0A445BB85_ARAHY|nr:hypothetical protein Ahy_A10g051025 [Arachis hypogaea]
MKILLTHALVSFVTLIIDDTYEYTSVTYYREILKGVNYASAAAGGIREETGRQLILYNYGARKMVLFGVGQIGCSPNELAQNNRDGTTCVERINSTNQIFNNGLKSLLINSTSSYPMQDSPTSTVKASFKIL